MKMIEEAGAVAEVRLLDSAIDDLFVTMIEKLRARKDSKAIKAKTF